MQAGQSEADQVKALGMAQQEMEYRVDLFNRCGDTYVQTPYVLSTSQCATYSHANLHRNIVWFYPIYASADC